MKRIELFGGDATILQGDCLDGLATLPERSVHCCVTSPPYYGQRDYGTAEWEGGNSTCDHVGAVVVAAAAAVGTKGDANKIKQQIQGKMGNWKTCPACGAYRVDQQVGLEETPEAYVERLVQVFRGVRRVLRNDGTLWCNLGDSYNAAGRRGHGTRIGYKQPTNRASAAGESSRPNDAALGQKQLLGMPWRVAFALQADGWTLRSDVIWHKPNAMPGSQRDRPSTNHEYVFLLTKGPRYFYDDVAIREPASTVGAAGKGTPDKAALAGCSTNGMHATTLRGVHDERTKRTVWTVNVASEKEAHFAVFPPKLILPCVLAGTSAKGCCARCGAPQRRAVAAVERSGKVVKDGSTATQTLRNDAATYEGRAGETSVKTVGWEPTCTCNAGTVPCTVLDPFGGSGTTGCVALGRHRRAILCELNPEYVEIMRRKLKRAFAKRGLGL